MLAKGLQKYSVKSQNLTTKKRKKNTKQSKARTVWNREQDNPGTLWKFWLAISNVKKKTIYEDRKKEEIVNCSFGHLFRSLSPHINIQAFSRSRPSNIS